MSYSGSAQMSTVSNLFINYRVKLTINAWAFCNNMCEYSTISLDLDGLDCPRSALIGVGVLIEQEFPICVTHRARVYSFR